MTLYTFIYVRECEGVSVCMCARVCMCLCIMYTNANHTLVIHLQLL